MDHVRNKKHKTLMVFVSLKVPKCILKTFVDIFRILNTVIKMKHIKLKKMFSFVI